MEFQRPQCFDRDTERGMGRHQARQKAFKSTVTWSGWPQPWLATSTSSSDLYTAPPSLIGVAQFDSQTGLQFIPISSESLLISLVVVDRDEYLPVVMTIS